MIGREVAGVTSYIYERYSSLFDTSPVPLDEIKSALAEFNFEAVILRLSQVNVLLVQSRLENSFDALQIRLFQQFFDDSIFERINDKYAGKSPHPPYIFFRLLVLYMMRLCAGACPVEGGRAINSVEEKYAFGRCCLWATDHLATEEDEKAISEGSSEERRRALGPQMAALAELGSPPNIKRSLARADIFFTELVHDPAVLQQSGGFDFLQAFRDAAGLTIEDYYNIVIFIISWFHGHGVQQMFEDTSKFVINLRHYVSLTHLCQDADEAFLNLNSVPVDQLPSVLLSHKGAVNRDFSSIQDKPLCSLGDGLVACLDVDYLLEKLSSGVYRLIVEGFTEDQKKKAQGAWGYLFEEYVNRIMGALHPQTRSSSLVGNFAQSPRYTTREEAFDGLLISPTNPRHVFVFQYKSQFLKPEIKYTDDVEAFERALDRKGSFGVGKKGGVRQLVDNIGLLWNKNKAERKRLFPPLGVMDGYEKVTPVLIVQESFFRGDFLNWTLNNRLQDLLAGANVSDGVAVEPLMVVDIESLEIMKPYVQAGLCTISQAINSLNEYDRERLAAFRRHIAVYLKQFSTINDLEVEERFVKNMERSRKLVKDEQVVP
jgi:hypothetical protein